MTNDSVRACFVLSAGRTGTVALANRLRQLFPKTLVVHEPPPARLELLFGNLRNDTGIGAELTKSLFLKVRGWRLGRLPPGRGYIEINPLLSPIVDLLPALGIPFNIVHMVRQPSSWAQSITAFGASSRYRAVIDYVPFAKPYPHPRPPGWRNMLEVERALWRWRSCNERILAIRSHCIQYALVRYEDVFSSSSDMRGKAFGTVVRMMPGNPVSSDVSIDPAERHNPAPRAEIAPPALDVMQAICGDLARQFGYSID